MYTIGVASDLHGSKKKARAIARRFKKEKVDLIVLNGDIPKDDDQYKNLSEILKIFAATKKKIIIQPGSHEYYHEYQRAVKKHKKQVTSYINVNHYDAGEFRLLFLPGSDININGAGFRLLDNKRKKKSTKKWLEHAWGKKVKLHFTSCTELKKKVKKNTILFCHVPPKFNKRTTIDVAHFGIAKKDFMIEHRNKKGEKKISIKEKGDLVTMPHAKEFIEAGAPIMMKTKNVGNKAVKEALKKYQIPFFVCGHIHEAGQRAHTITGKKLRANSWHKTLYYNSGCGALGKAGLLYLQEGKIKYKNVNV